VVVDDMAVRAVLSVLCATTPKGTDP
jgi:hypothetical protein